MKFSDDTCSPIRRMGADHPRPCGHVLMTMPYELEQFLADTLGPATPTEPQEYVFNVQFYNVARELAKTLKPWKPSYPGEHPPFWWRGRMANLILAAIVCLWLMGVALIFAGIVYITYQIAKG